MNAYTDIKAKAGADAIAKPIQLAHVVLHTSRFVEMVDWYKSVLQMYPSYEDDHISFLTFDEEHHRVALVSVPGLQERADGHVGVHHMAFTFRNLTELLATHERLAAQGIQPYWAVNHGITVSLYFNDPDRNRVELQVDVFATADEALAYCAGPDFKENPIGVDFDPAEMLARLRAGATEAELKVRPNIGPRGLASGFPMG